MKFHRKLDLLMERRNDRNVDLVRLTGANPSTVTRWRNGQKTDSGNTYRPTTEQFLTLARHYRVPMEELVDDALELGTVAVPVQETELAPLLPIVRQLGVERALARLAMIEAPAVVRLPESRPAAGSITNPDARRPDDGDKPRRKKSS